MLPEQGLVATLFPSALRAAWPVRHLNGHSSRRGDPGRKHHGDGSHHTPDQVHGLEQQQNGEVQRRDEEQAAHERTHNEVTVLFHIPPD
jgi:hypothetical protein